MPETTGEPRVVGAGRGASWWSEGWRIFASSALRWIGIMLIYLAVSWIMNRVPYLGGAVQWLLAPVFLGGLMLGCRSLEREATLRLGQLFEGFRGARLMPLMTIGLTNIALSLAIVATGAIAVFGFVEAAAMLRMRVDPVAGLNEIFDAMGRRSGLAGVLVFVILGVFALLNWFAPSLVALRGMSAMDAMKLSSVAVLRNWMSFLVYGGVGIAIAAAASLAQILVVLILGANAISGLAVPSEGAVVGTFVMLGLLATAFGAVIVPTICASMYAAYKDVFEGEEARGAEETPASAAENV